MIKDQKMAIVNLLKKGEVLTGLKALRLVGTMKLATRIGELQRQGYVIKKDWTKLPSGARVRTYYM